jgi:hypothetical protein
MNALVAPFELTDAELDLVTGGNTAVAGLGLANIALSTGNISVLSGDNFNIPVLNNVTLRDIANNNNVGVGVLIQALGGVAAILQHQA